MPFYSKILVTICVGGDVFSHDPFHQKVFGVQFQLYCINLDEVVGCIM
jgi:hypothetical protein